MAVVGERNKMRSEGAGSGRCVAGVEPFPTTRYQLDLARAAASWAFGVQRHMPRVTAERSRFTAWEAEHSLAMYMPFRSIKRRCSLTTKRSRKR